MKCVAIAAAAVVGLASPLACLPACGAASGPSEPVSDRATVDGGRLDPGPAVVAPGTAAEESTSAAMKPAAGRATPVAPAGPPKKLLAKKFVANIRSAPSKQASKLGYLRAGAITLAKTAEPVGYDRCRKGWFELQTGGFVCSTVDVIAYTGRRPQERLATQPDLDARLPYPYGYCRRTGTPVFKRLPTPAEAELFDPKPAPPNPAGAVDAGPSPTDPAAIPSAEPSEAPPPGRLAGRPGGGESDGQADPATPEVSTLASLLGDPDSVLARRMERGFYVSLDRDMRRGGRRYWRTQANGFIPYRRIVPVRGSAFEGLLLAEASSIRAGTGPAGASDAGMAPDAGAASAYLPVAFVMSRRARAYRLDPRGRLRKGRPAGYHHRLVPVSETQWRGRAYLADSSGTLYRARDLRRVARRARPEGVAADERWIDVNLTRQTLVAYEGDEPVYATLISSGRIKDPDDPLKNFETPTGSYRISSKHLTATMDGDHAVDGPYSIEDVPYVMFFHQAYAFHAAFWHNGFGRPRSHGCINLAPADARFLFRFASPELPHPWHGAYPTESAPGTRVFIHGETPKG